MKKKSVICENGEEVFFFDPEDDNDEEVLRKMIKAGRCSANASFGDWNNTEGQIKGEPKEDGDETKPE